MSTDSFFLSHYHKHLVPHHPATRWPRLCKMLLGPWGACWLSTSNCGSYSFVDSGGGVRSSLVQNSRLGRGLVSKRTLSLVSSATQRAWSQGHKETRALAERRFSVGLSVASLLCTVEGSETWLGRTIGGGPETRTPIQTRGTLLKGLRISTKQGEHMDERACVWDMSPALEFAQKPTR